MPLAIVWKSQADGTWKVPATLNAQLIRTYIQSFGNKNRARPGDEADEAFQAPSDELNSNESVTSDLKIRKTKADTLVAAAGADAAAIGAINDNFDEMNRSIRLVEKAWIDAEPSHLDSLLQFASIAYRRPLSKAEQVEQLRYYRE